MIPTRTRFLQALRWSLHSAHPEARPWLLGILGTWSCMQLLVQAGRRVDRIRLSGGPRSRPHAPVFVVGHPRSGTTRLHRLLALDPRFSTMHTWETLLPSRSLQRMVHTAHRVHPSLIRAFADHIDQRLESLFSEGHPTGLRLPEEDELVHLQNLSAAHIWLLFGEPSLAGMGWARDRLPIAEQQHHLALYRTAVEAFLSQQPAHTTYLSKNPFHSEWMSTLSAAFPQGRFILLSREPEESIASTLMNLHSIRQRLDPTHRPRGDWSQALVDRSVALIRESERTFQQLAVPRRIRVGYRELMRDPARVCDRIYAHFGWTEGEAVRQLRAEATEQARRRRPGRVPKLRPFGVSSAELKARLAGCDQLWQFLEAERAQRGPAPRTRAGEPHQPTRSITPGSRSAAH